MAVPAEVKTQVMKHAALLDVDLLCCLASSSTGRVGPVGP